MNKFIFLLLLILFSACDDGDLQIETLDFDSVTIQNCDVITVDVSNVLFKLNTTEALILELPAGSIKNEISDQVTPTPLTVSSSGTTKITYRTFSDNISNSYFCSDIPITIPTVVEEIVAESGEVYITSVLNADGVTYEHTIEFSEISLVTSKDTRITDLSINNFGTVTTILTE